MSRAAHPPEVLARAKELRDKQRLSYRRIAGQLYTEFKIEVGESTIRDWVTYRTRGA